MMFSTMKAARKTGRVNSSLESMLAWRCGYATGLRVALRMLSECNDPPSRIKRELHGAMAEARDAYRSVEGSEVN